MRHLIKKQIIEVGIDRSLNHFRVQQQISERYWKEVLPLLEKAFDAISADDELIEIDHFELDLGVVSVEEMEKESWTVDIRKKIQERIIAISDPASVHYAIKSRHRRLGTFEQWIYYMDHGFLAWNTPKPDEEWRRDVLEAIAVDIGSHQTLRQRISEDHFFLRRVVAQHGGDFLHKLAEITTARKQDALQAGIDELLYLFNGLRTGKELSANDTDREFKYRSWEWVLASAAGKGSRGSGEPLIDGLVRSFVKEYSLTTDIPPAIALKIPLILPRYQKYAGESKVALQQDKNKPEKLVSEVSDTEKSGRDKLSAYKPDVPEEVSRYNSRLIDGEGIFIVNAGVILLHPFLKSLFSRLELLSGTRFVSREAQVTAVALVHYLATGRQEADEFELTMPKILVAFSLQEPVQVPEELPAGYIQEANELLEAAISEWAILKNTSPNGLREGFLQRGGKLYTKAGSLMLQVEKASIDLLLDYLPWNLGIVKLPWLKDVLRVEWR